MTLFHSPDEMLSKQAAWLQVLAVIGLMEIIQVLRKRALSPDRQGGDPGQGQVVYIYKDSRRFRLPSRPALAWPGYRRAWLARGTLAVAQIGHRLAFVRIGNAQVPADCDVGHLHGHRYLR